MRKVSRSFQFPVGPPRATDQAAIHLIARIDIASHSHLIVRCALSRAYLTLSRKGDLGSADKARGVCDRENDLMGRQWIYIYSDIPVKGAHVPQEIGL